MTGKIARAGVVVCLLLGAACSKKNPEEKAMTPQDSIKAMHLSDDFHIELFASEPDVMSPVEMAFDEGGKIYVAEMMDYPDDPPEGKPVRSRIRLLQDTQGNGKFKTTVFADHVLAVSGFMPWKGGLIVTSAPDILFMKDTDGDGVADVKKVLFTGFAKSNQESRVTNPRLGVDNWIYCSNMGNNGRITSPDHPEMEPVLVRGTDFRFDPISGKGEEASGPAQFGSTLDDYGNRFITQNTTHLRQVILPMHYIARAPLLEVSAEAQDISDHGRPSARMYPLTGPQEWRKQRTNIRQQRYNDNQANVTEQVGGWFTAASGSTLYTGDNFPQEYVGNIFTGDVSGNLIHRDVILPGGSTLVAHRAKDGIEFLASTDVWFRPCNFYNAPDGNLYFTDIYRQVIETPESIPEEIKKKINFYNGDTMGRIYRIVPNHPRRQGSLKVNLGAASSAELVAQLANPNGWNRWTAHRLLLERQDHSVVDALKALAANGPTPESRVHALWLLKAFSGLDAALVQSALANPLGHVRENALQLAEGLMSQSKPLATAVLAAAGDPDQRVQLQAALTIGDLKDPKAFSTLAELAHQRSADTWFRTAILTSSSDSASTLYHALLAKGETWVDPQMLTELSALIGARQNPRELSQWWMSVSKLSHPDGVLEGLERGLSLSNARYLKVSGAEPAVRLLVKSKDEAVQRAAWNAALYFDFPAMMQQAAKEAIDAKGDPGQRVLAIRALRGGHFSASGPVLEQILQSLPVPDVEAAAIDSLASFSEPDSGKIILKHWATYTHDGRTHALDAMVMHRNRAPMLLAAVKDGTVKRSALDPAVISHLLENPDPAVAKEAHAQFASLGASRENVVTAYHDVLQIPGDPQKGKVAFAGSCGRCHMPRLRGGRVGPDLSGINNKTKEELLTDILNPNYAIEPRFINYVLTTRDGYVYDGVIANETPGSISLRGGSVERDHTVLRKNVAEIQPSKLSLMPDGLEQTLSKEDLANIISYLRGGL
jgi:putative membrane-bound dehydrogenase-like protein